MPAYADRFTFIPCLAAIVATPGSNIAIDTTEEHLLGLSLAICFRGSPETGPDKNDGRTLDGGIVLGPAITTPDELEEDVDYFGTEKTYNLNVSVRINGEERLVWSVMDLPLTVGRALSFASESTAVAPGDVFCLRPIGVETIFEKLGRSLDRGDEIQLVCDRLGAVSTTLS
jgi:2-keto-4-pentenoate hydratase/2-oxohepta-3-ene-1,7-dioic acid hydratase in catechol pathway